jgi:sulfonate transport system substrate-binding protein
MPYRLPLLRHVGVRSVLALFGTGAVIALAAGGPLAPSAGAAPKKSAAPNLSGVTITFGDQFKQYQTILTAANALKGAAYTVNWSDFIGGPPLIAAETGGSVDLGDTAETPLVFAQAAGDPIKVVAATVSANAKVSPYDLVVPASSKIKKVSQLRGQTVAVQEGTVEQYVLIQALKKAGVPYSAVHIDNLSVVNAAAAVSSGQVTAAVISEPLTSINLTAGKIHVLASAAGSAQTLGYLSAPQSALDNPQKAAAIADFINRFYKAAAFLKKNPGVAAASYAKIYGVTLAEAKEAAATVQQNPAPLNSSIISYQQAEANTFLQLGLIAKKLNVKSDFDLPFNKAVNAKAGIK